MQLGLMQLGLKRPALSGALLKVMTRRALTLWVDKSTIVGLPTDPRFRAAVLRPYSTDISLADRSRALIGLRH